MKKNNYYHCSGENHFEILKKCLEVCGIPSMYYSLDGYKEMAICVSKDNTGWIVFDGERGGKHDILHFEKAEDACTEVIKRLTEASEGAEEIIQTYDRMT